MVLTPTGTGTPVMIHGISGECTNGKSGNILRDSITYDGRKKHYDPHQR
ncbi:MAG: hypothetical protein NT072_11760 [Deltaproteobacteria bacterium]|nr:hypothetical protein [Deltaproteobacteria bacterium]